MFSHGGLLPGGDSTADCHLRTTDGWHFLAQRGFLSATSRYFRALFGEEYGSPRDVLVSGVKGSALDILLTFLYTDQLFVSVPNVMDVLQAADMLLLDEPREQCLKLLLRYMAPENCLSLAALTRRYPYPKFTKTVMNYALLHFDQAWRCSEEFGDTPAWLLDDLLASPELNVPREEDALEAIARWWYSTTRAEDSSWLPHLLRCIRIGLCESEALDAFRERWPALTERTEFKEAITEALELGPCMDSGDRLLLKLRGPKKAPPIRSLSQLLLNPGAGPAAMLNAAGEASVAFKAVETAATGVAAEENAAANAVAPEAVASAEAGSPTTVYHDFMTLSQAHCSTCGLANPERWLPRLPTELIFVVGGWCKRQSQSTFETFDNRVNRWFKFKNYSDDFQPRAYHGLVQWRRRLFVVGGLYLPCYLPLHQASFLRSLDSFDLDRCKWRHHSPMHVARAYVAAVALGDHIYAIGGNTGVERTRTVERYEPVTNQWIMVAAMNRRRSDGSACVSKGHIFVSGGFSGSHILETVEMYSPDMDSWTIVQSLPSPRCSHRMVVHSGRIYVIGGKDGQRTIAQVISSEDSLPLSWREMPSLTTPRSTFAVAQLGDDLYVIGGYNGTSLVANVEKYTPGDKSWREAEPLNTPTRAISACTVQGIEVCRKFSARRGAMLCIEHTT